ncbi:MAG: RDD family protein [Bifidobacteriaceae bacterium]|nr:RDD family protein [Bifidobacteriaceae bacterium]
MSALSPAARPSRDEVVTAEAVVLDVTSASVMTRAVGALIDIVVYTIVLFAAADVVAHVAPAGASGDVAIIVTTALCLLGIPVAVETFTHGRSVGKAVMGLRVVRDDGGPIQPRHALVRGLLAILELWGLPFIALITGFCSKRSKRLGDMLAGTYSARVRGVKSQFAPLWMPPQLAGWGMGADVGRIPDPLALRARLFLARAGSMTPPLRARLGYGLAAAVEPYVQPAPPLGTPAELYLAAVLARRRDQEARADAEHIRAAGQLLAPVGRLGFGLQDPAQ